VTLGWCDHVYPRWEGHTTDILQFPHVLGAPVSLIGSELSGLLGSDPSICLAPDAAGVVLCTHMMPGNTSILYLPHLVLSGWGYAELPLYGVLRSSSSKDMQMGAEVQNEKAPPR